MLTLLETIDKIMDLDTDEDTRRKACSRVAIADGGAIDETNYRVMAKQIALDYGKKVPYSDLIIIAATLSGALAGAMVKEGDECAIEILTSIMSVVVSEFELALKIREDMKE